MTLVMVSAAACMADAQPLSNCEVGKALSITFFFFPSILNERRPDGPP